MQGNVSFDYMKSHLLVSFIIGGVTLTGLLFIQLKYASYNNHFMDN